MGPRRSAAPLAVLAVLALSLGGCSSGEDFPTGRWRWTTLGDGAFVVDYREDGTYAVLVGPSTLQMEQFASGTYEASGDELRFITDNGCGDVSGTYTWQLDRGRAAVGPGGGRLRDPAQRQ